MSNIKLFHNEPPLSNIDAGACPKNYRIKRTLPLPTQAAFRSTISLSA